MSFLARARAAMPSPATLATVLLVGGVAGGAYVATRHTQRAVRCQVTIQSGTSGGSGESGPAMSASATYFIDFEHATMDEQAITMTPDRIAWKRTESPATATWTRVSEGTIDRATGALSERSTRTAPNEAPWITLTTGTCTGVE